MTLKFIFGLITGILAVACMTTRGSEPPCYHDEGIKLATTYAYALSNPKDKKIQIMEYDKRGRPLKRKELDSRITRYVYQGIHLKATLMNDVPLFNSDSDLSVFDSFSMDFSYIGVSDTNWVTSSDAFGRPLVITGSDGNVLSMEYEDCAKEVQEYKDESGGIIFHGELFKMDGLPQKTIFVYGGNSEDKNIVNYFDYKFNKEGHWIERKYNYGENEIVLENRELVLYE